MQRTDSDKIRGTFDAQIIPKSRHGAFITLLSRECRSRSCFSKTHGGLRMATRFEAGPTNPEAGGLTH